jgi:hypothetical protein
MYRCALYALAAASFVAPAAAQQRNFPPQALRGALVIQAPPQALLNNQAARLAPRARIWGQNNMLQMSASLVGTKLLVHYTLDPQGLIRDVWILTPDEATRQPWPTTSAQARAWSFDPVAQSWTRP